MLLPIQPTDYILDITTMLERQRLDYWLFLKKVAWFQPIHLENTLLVNLLHHQVGSKALLLFVEHFAE